MGDEAAGAARAEFAEKVLRRRDAYNTDPISLTLTLTLTLTVTLTRGAQDAGGGALTLSH